jgi:hypothetical protein
VKTTAEAATVGVDMISSKGAATEEINRAGMDTNKAVAMEETNRVDTDNSREGDTDSSREEDTDSSREGDTDSSREEDTDSSREGDTDNSKVDMDRAVAREAKEGMAMTTMAPPEVVAGMGLRIALTKDMEVGGISTKRAADQAMALEATLTRNKLQTTPSNMAVETAACSRPPCPSWAARDSTISQTRMSNS